MVNTNILNNIYICIYIDFPPTYRHSFDFLFVYQTALRYLGDLIAPDAAAGA